MRGFTLLETVITVGILLTLAGLITSSWPRIKERQAILIAREELQSLFRQAQQQALNEDRSENCLNQVESDPASRRRCSDIGVAIKETQVRLFADTEGDNNRYSANDVMLEEYTLHTPVRSASTEWESFLFKGTPPLIELYDPSGSLVQGSRQAFIRLNVGTTSQEIYISPYGQVEE